jgi:broad specificity phosphatase PhoE
VSRSSRSSRSIRRASASSAARLVALFVALFVTRGNANAQPSTVILVRHGEKAATPADDPALSAAGMQRARDLAVALADAHVTNVITTQFLRTQATARPLDESLHLTPVIVPAAADARAHAEAVAARARSTPAGSVVLIVGHSNTVPAIIAALGGPRLPDLCDTEYATLFVLEFPATGPPRLIRARYGAPDPLAADSCARSMRQP